MSIDEQVLNRLRPTPAEREALTQVRTELEVAATQALQKAGIAGEALVQGSVAKDTWIAGNTDLDCFLVLSRDTPEKEFEAIVSMVAQATLTNPQKKYAQHPYIIGTRDGYQVDLVPAYRIDDATERLSAVDRTPLHTAWVLEHLDDEARDQVRLAKQWCKGVGVYGAETRIGGFSGYLVEVLIQAHGDFHGFLQWCAAGAFPGRDEFPLHIPDPVDADRNVAAAVTQRSLDRVREGAQAYLDTATEEFFFPAPPSTASADALNDALQSQGAQWTGLVLTPQTDRLDLVFPQFQRAARLTADALQRAGFPVRRLQVDAFDDDGAIGLQWVTDAIHLAPTTVHRGPRADREPNASGFRSKWTDHPDAVGEVETDADGFLAVTVKVPARTAPEWLQLNHGLCLTGKHVVAALGDAPRVLDSPAEAPTSWGPIVTDVVLDRRPWQRT